MSKRGKRPRNALPRRVRCRTAMPGLPCYIQLIGPHPAICRCSLGCHTTHRQPVAAMGLIMATIACKTVFVPPTHISRGHSVYANTVGFATFLGFFELSVRCAKISFRRGGYVYIS